jgi:hypothetical protein
MKLVNSFVAACAVLVAVAAPVFAISLPNTGTYFIINNSSSEALQPAGAMVGQNVLMYAADKSGMQKWLVTRNIDPKTKKPTNRYSIQLAGENGDLYLQPHDIAGAASILLQDKSTFVLEAGEDGILVKSPKRNGDAMFIFPSPPMYAEARFGPSDGSAKFMWTFEPAN